MIGAAATARLLYAMGRDNIAPGSAFLTLVGATSLVPFIVYLLTVIAYGIRRRKLAHMSGTFHLGKWAAPVCTASLVWLVAAVLVLSLPQEFHRADYYVLGGLALAAIWWAVGLRHRLRQGTAKIGHIPGKSGPDVPASGVAEPPVAAPEQ